MLKRYEHYDVVQALLDLDSGNSSKFAVITINWTTATIRRKKDPTKVHRNIYVFTLPELIKFIRETEEVAEDIVFIQPL